jgi:uncharacterized membrane-anchored protein
MITEEKIKQIRRQLSKGEPEGEIKNALRNDGLSEDEITALFYNLFPKKTESKKSGSTENGNAQLFYLIGACFIIAGGSMLANNTWLKQFGIPLIVLGAVSLCVTYFIANKNKDK